MMSKQQTDSLRPLHRSGRSEEAQSPYVNTEKFLLGIGRIEMQARYLYIILQSFAWGEKDSCFPKISTLATMCGVGRTAVKHWLRVLIDEGLIERVQRTTKSNLYILHDPEEVLIGLKTGLPNDASIGLKSDWGRADFSPSVSTKSNTKKSNVLPRKRGAPSETAQPPLQDVAGNHMEFAAAPKTPVSHNAKPSSAAHMMLISALERALGHPVEPFKGQLRSASALAKKGMLVADMAPCVAMIQKESWYRREVIPPNLNMTTVLKHYDKFMALRSREQLGDRGAIPDSLTDEAHAVFSDFMHSRQEGGDDNG